MRDESFQIFVEAMGEASSSEAVPRTSLDKYREILPPSLLTIWQEEGWCSYSNGLFWTADPDEYAHLVDMWLEDTPLASADRYHMIGRSAFGALYLWGEKNNRSVTVCCAPGYIIAMADEINVPARDADIALLSFFALTNRVYCDMRDGSGEYLFDRALKQLGPLDKTQMYGFEPALSLGGRLRLENLNKVNLDVHLTILRELSAPSMPYLDTGGAGAT